MLDRRAEPRMLCADLVDVKWKDQTGRTRRGVANLEDISLSGACLQVDRPVALGTNFQISYPSGELVGKVKYCVFREIGYFLGIEFEDGSRWSQRHYRPQHLLDPRRLVNRVTNRLKTDLPAAPPST
ncbi:MAG: PilZ domain-containing protein [Bryobacteraceae bacterium]